MGFLIYGHHEHEFEDRLLAHIKTASGVKLRKHEPFFLNWTKSAKDGSGRMAIWITPYIPLSFRFAGGRQPVLNATWVRVLEELADTPFGMRVLSEDDAEKYAREHF